MERPRLGLAVPEPFLARSAGAQILISGKSGNNDTVVRNPYFYELGSSDLLRRPASVNRRRCHKPVA